MKRKLIISGIVTGAIAMSLLFTSLAQGASPQHLTVAQAQAKGITTVSVMTHPVDHPLVTFEPANLTDLTTDSMSQMQADAVKYVSNSSIAAPDKQYVLFSFMGDPAGPRKMPVYVYTYADSASVCSALPQMQPEGRPHRVITHCTMTLVVDPVNGQSIMTLANER